MFRRGRIKDYQLQPCESLNSDREMKAGTGDGMSKVRRYVPSELLSSLDL